MEQQLSHELSSVGEFLKTFYTALGALMVLNIKNDRDEQLARQDAAATGESTPVLVETLMAISQRCSGLPDLDNREADEILGYDEEGGFI